MPVRRCVYAIVAFLAVLLVAGASLACRAPALSAEARTPAIRYTMTVDVDYDRSFLNVAQVVSFPNRGTTPLSSIVFQVTPASPAFNAFLLSSAMVGTTAVTPLQDGTIMEIPLSPPLAAGETVSITLRWGGRVPPSNGRYGVVNGVMALGNWYPQVAVLQDGVWERHQYTAIGDAFFTEIADYDVTVNAPAGVVVASSAAQASRTAGQWVFHIQDARDFALALSNNFQTMSRKVDNVAITVYHLPGHSEGAKVGLDTAEQAMRWYAAKLGPYPFAALAIVEVPGGVQHNAQEHAGLFFIRSDFFTASLASEYTAHELAHAWFFAAVGNDQIRHPWVDEALVTSISMDFYRETAPKVYGGLWGKWGGAPEEFTNSPVLNLGINDFKAGEGSAYFWTVYRQGAAFFRVVREAMGEDAYWKALRRYYEEFKGRIARPQDLLRILRQASDKADLVPIYRTYFDYPYLKLPNLTLEIAGADGQVMQGQLSVPITVTADSPTYTLTVLLDGRVMTTSHSAATVVIDAATMSNGQHELRAVADDGGLNRVERTRLFLVANPTPTPTATATRPPNEATPTATVTAIATAKAAAALATPAGTPAMPTPAPVTTLETDGRLTSVLGLVLAAAALVAAALVWRRKHRRRRW